MLFFIAFVLLFIAVLLVWYGRREESIYTFVFTLILSISLFIHHITDVIGLSL